MGVWWQKTKKDETRRYARGEHVMSQPEAKVMRRIQAETGLTEEQVRSHKKYRIMLSETQKHAKQPGYVTNVEPSNLTPREQFMLQVSTWALCDQAMAERLYKRFGSIMMMDDGPKNFHYATISKCHHGLVMKAIDQSTDGMFVYNPAKREVGFMYESNLTMFLMTYDYNKKPTE